MRSGGADPIKSLGHLCIQTTHGVRTQSGTGVKTQLGTGVRTQLGAGVKIQLGTGVMIQLGVGVQTKSVKSVIELSSWHGKSVS